MRCRQVLPAARRALDATCSFRASHLALAPWIAVDRLHRRTSYEFSDGADTARVRGVAVSIRVEPGSIDIEPDRALPDGTRRSLARHDVRLAL
jgi:hypothetical protein